MKTLIQCIRKFYRIMSTDGTTNAFTLKTTVIIVYYSVIMPLMLTEIQLNLGDMDYVLDIVLDMSLLTLLTLMTFIITTLRKSKVYQLLDVLSGDLFLYRTPFSKHQLSIRWRTARHARQFVYFIIIVTAIGIIVKMLPALFFLWKNFDRINPGDRMNFPLKCWFPFDIDSALKYLSCFAATGIGFTTVSAFYIMTSSIFVSSIVYARRELRILTVTLQELDGRSERLQRYAWDTTRNELRPLEYYLHVCMTEVIQHHNKIIR